MLVAITGSSGQVGTNLAHRCLDAGHAVIGFDVRSNTWSSRFPTWVCDLVREDPAVLAERVEALRGRQREVVVVHLAAHAKVHQLVDEPSKAFENIAMLRSVLELCRMRGLPIVYASSREVYGDPWREKTAEEHADFTGAASTYAASKVAGESMINAYARCYGLRHMIFRLSNVYGRYDNDLSRMTRVVPLFMHQISAGIPVTVFGVEKVLDFTHVDDCIDGLMAGLSQLQSGRLSGHVFNLARGEGNSLVALAEFIGQALGMRPEINIADTLPGEIRRYVSDISKARAMLGFAPAVSLGDGVRRALEWSLEAAAVRSTAPGAARHSPVPDPFESLG
jgi:nucleoside-diphosphate-sugar epimerase